jgi:biopolymer transport protein ExbB
MNDILSQTRGFLELGGPVVAILLALSVVALAIVLMKLAQFARERVGGEAAARQALSAWAARDYAAAIECVEGHPSPLSATLARAMHLSMRPGTAKQSIEEDVAIVAAARLHELQRGLRALDAIAQIAPLLGLFGTVLGMIEAFQRLQGAGNAVDPSLLAGGIWVALLTTAVGLAVAMPASLLVTWFETRIENERIAIETLTGAFLSQRALASRTETLRQDDLVPAH